MDEQQPEMAVGISAKAPEGVTPVEPNIPQVAIEEVAPPIPDEESMIKVAEMAETPDDSHTTAPPAPRKKEDVFAPVYVPQVPKDLTPTSFYSQADAQIKTGQTITDDSLRNDKLFLTAGRVLAKRDYPDTWQDMDDEKIGTYFLTKLNRANYNISRAVSDSFEYESAPDIDKAAYAYGLKMYEGKDWSAEGLMGAAIGVTTDYFNIGLVLGTGGLGAVAKAAGGKSISAKLLGTIMRNPRKAMAAGGAVEGAAGDLSVQGLGVVTGAQKEINKTQAAISTTIGAVAPRVLEEGIKGLSKGYKTAKEWAEEGLSQAAGGGMPTFDALLKSLDGKPIKEKQKQISANLRFLEGAEKQKAIAHLKDMTPKKKPKKPKKAVQEKITEREEFNEQFYSKLENSVNKLDDNKAYTPEELYKTLKEMGVKDDEIQGSGLAKRVARFDGKITGQETKELLSYREDKITKNTLDADTAGSVIEKDDYLDYISVDEGTSVSEGESGYGANIRDEYTGQEGEVGVSYSEDYYVDDGGNDIGDYDDMRNDWYEYYANDDHKSIAREQLTDEGIEIDADNLKERTLEVAGDESPWYDYYGQKEYFTHDRSSEQFESMDEALEDAKDLMYEDYVDRAEYEGGNGEIFEGYTIDGGDDYRMEIYKMEDFQGDGNTHYEPHLEHINQEAENVQVHARMKTRTDANGKTGTVLEELQSQWEQDWRAQGGGKKLPTMEEKDVAQKEIDTIEKEVVKQETIADEYANARSKIVDEKTRIRQLHKVEIQDEVQNLYKQRKDIDEQIAEIQKEYEANPGMGFEEPRARVKELKAMQDKIEDKEEALTGAYKEDPRYIELESKQVGADYDYRQQKGKVNDIRNKQVPYKKIINAKPPSLSTPPISKRTQYEKLGIADNLLNSIKAGEDYFGFINGHIQNGSRIETTVGMSQAYDIEMPRIVQKMTGETPYMADFETGKPVTGKKVMWDGKKAAEDLEYYDNIDAHSSEPGTDWYWRVDYTPEVKSKLKDAKMEVYGVGGLSLIGATQGEDNEN